MNKNIKNICINGIGIALFVVLSMCLRVPIFENYYLCLGYIVMTVYLYYFGIINGTLISTLGIILYCILINGLRGMPGWAIGNIAMAIVIGNVFRFSKKINNKHIRTIIYDLGIIIAVTIGILGIKSIIEVFLYEQPFILRIANNIYAFVADIVVIIASLPIVKILRNPINKINNHL